MVCDGHTAIPRGVRRTSIAFGLSRGATRTAIPRGVRRTLIAFGLSRGAMRTAIPRGVRRTLIAFGLSHCVSQTLFYCVVKMDIILPRGRDGVAVVSNNSRNIVRNTGCPSRLA